jgi:hypothetical protein
VTGYLLNLADKVKGDLQNAADAKALFTARALQEDLMAAYFPDAPTKPEDELGVVLDPLADMVRYIKTLDSASHFPKPPPTSDSEAVLAVRHAYPDGLWFVDSPDGPSLRVDIEPAVTARGMSLSDFNEALRYLLTDSGLAAAEQRCALAQEKATKRMRAKIADIRQAIDLCLGGCPRVGFPDLPAFFVDLLDEYESIDVPDKPTLDREDILRRRNHTASWLWNNLLHNYNDTERALRIARVALSEYRAGKACPPDRTRMTIREARSGWEDHPEYLEPIRPEDWPLYPSLSTIRQSHEIMANWRKRCFEVDADLEVLSTTGLGALLLKGRKLAAVARLEAFVGDFKDMPPLPKGIFSSESPDERLAVVGYLRKFTTR